MNVTSPNWALAVGALAFSLYVQPVIESSFVQVFCALEITKSNVAPAEL